MSRLRLFAGLLALASLAQPATGQGSTPSVHLLLREMPAPDGLNVLFLGDGFDSSHLLNYRVVVNELAESLQQVDVFGAHYERFNFYRIDVVDSTGLTASSCGSSVPSLNSLTIAGDPGPSVGATATADLGVERCWNGGNEGILYTWKEAEALSYGQYVPAVKSIVIVANASLVSGGAQILVTSGQTTLVVVGASVSTKAGVTEIDPTAVALFAHELSHSLGLFDEYDGGVGLAKPTFDPTFGCRNVWKPAVAPQWPLVPTWPVTERIPWQCSLKNCCTPASMARCKASGSDCHLDGVSPLSTQCPYVPESANPKGPGSCGPHKACQMFPGAWEGAFYESKDYYRARHTCRMRSMSIDRIFCEACREYLDLYLDHFGSDKGTGIWPDDRCASAEYCSCGGP